MAMNTIPAAERQNSPGQTASAASHDLDWHRLRILRCTAHAMASSPGGLRFKAGTRPWLDGLPAGRPVFPSRMPVSPMPECGPLALDLSI